METSCRIYDDLINNLNYIVYTYMYLSVVHQPFTDSCTANCTYNVPHARLVCCLMFYNLKL